MRTPIAFALALLIVPAPSAHAGGLDLDLLGPRGIGRAGATLASEDGAIALLSNPAGIVRRLQSRLQVGVAVHDSDSRYDSPVAGTPAIVDRGPTAATPLFGYVTSIGEIAVAAVYNQTGDMTHALPRAEVNQCYTAECLDDLDRLFPHRYGGTGVATRRHTFSIGAAKRVNDWLGIGVSIESSFVELSESRAIWAGFSGRDMPLGTPLRDMTLTMTAHDPVVPGATFGALVAPYVVPMELAMSVGYRMARHLGGGDTSLVRANSLSFPSPQLGNATSELTLAGTLTFRAGVRYVGEKLLAEVDGEAVVHVGDDDATWQLGGIQVVDDTQLVADLTSVPALVALRDHVAVRAAADIELVPGFLWVTTGYAFRTAAQARDRYAPAYTDVGGHTIAIGAEGQWSDMTFTIGYAKTLAHAIEIEQNSVNMINPFDAGTRGVGAGKYDAGHDAFGASVEISWE